MRGCARSSPVCANGRNRNRNRERWRANRRCSHASAPAAYPEPLISPTDATALHDQASDPAGVGAAPTTSSQALPPPRRRMPVRGNSPRLYRTVDGVDNMLYTTYRLMDPGLAVGISTSGRVGAGATRDAGNTAACLARTGSRSRIAPLAASLYHPRLASLLA